MTVRRSVLALLDAALISTYPVAQLDTIPSHLARRGSLHRMTTIPSGLPPTIDHLLQQTDLIVRGTVAEPRSYMTKKGST